MMKRVTVECYARMRYVSTSVTRDPMADDERVTIKCHACGYSQYPRTSPSECFVGAIYTREMKSWESSWDIPGWKCLGKKFETKIDNPSFLRENFKIEIWKVKQKWRNGMVRYFLLCYFNWEYRINLSFRNWRCFGELQRITYSLSETTCIQQTI